MKTLEEEIQEITRQLKEILHENYLFFIEFFGFGAIVSTIFLFICILSEMLFN